MAKLRAAFVTVGNPARQTGGYLYHAQVFPLLEAHGITVEQVVAAEAGREAQQQAAAGFGAQFEPRRYDLVVVDALARAVCAPHLAQWQRQRPLVAMIHELPSAANNAPEEQADEAGLLAADAMIAVSRHGAGLLVARGADPARIVIASPGYDRVAATPAPAEPSDLPVALCVAQWIPRKGLHDLLAAWTMRRGSAARLMLVGETNANPAYAAELAALLAHTSSVDVRGPVDDAALDQAYRSAALFVLPSHFEGYGMVYAEALSYCLPVVACAVGPVLELLGEAGVLVPPGEPVALAAALDRVLGDPALREQLAAHARARVRSLPTWQDTAAAFAGALRMALARPEQP